MKEYQLDLILFLTFAIIDYFYIKIYHIVNHTTEKDVELDEPYYWEFLS